MLNIEETSTETEPENQTELAETVADEVQLTNAQTESEIPDEAILNSKMASGVGRRNQAEPDHEADASRVAVAVDKVGRWLGFSAPETEEGLIEVASIGKDKVLVRPSSITVRSSGGAVTVYNDGSQPIKPSLGRGGWTAVGLVLVFLPVLVVLSLLAFNLEQSLEAQQLKNYHFQRQSDESLQTKLSEALNNPQSLVIKMKSLEGLPEPGAMTMYQPPLANWLLAFSNLNKLEQGQIYVAWFAKQHEAVPAKNGDNYLYIADFNGNITRSGVTEITSSGLYKDKQPQDYTEMIITVESANQKEYKQPTAPIYFVAPLPANHF